MVPETCEAVDVPSADEKEDVPCQLEVQSADEKEDVPCQLEDSIWDASLFVGLGCLGVACSAWTVMLLLVNLFIQVESTINAA